MDCWLTDQTEFTFDGNKSCKEQVENCPLVSNTQALERLDLVGLSFSHDVRQSYSMSSEPSVEVFSDENNVVSPLCVEKETGFKVSTKFGESNTQDLSLIDLKLGGLSNGGGVEVGEFLSASVPSSSNMSSVLVKRSRSTILNPLAPCCQVFGCNKDLSYSKGYYKRHKVCELHTKTAKVVVDGIEQRFCQQCSRFHLLSEFDDIKRSCRRRLAAHNKRRRKPQFGSESGSKLIGFSSQFGFSQLFHGTLFDSGEEMGSFVQDVKDNTIDVQRLSGIQQTNGALSLLSSKSHSHSHTMSSPLLGAADPNPPKSDYALERHPTETSRTETSTTSYCDGISRIYSGHDDIEANTNFHNPLGRGIVLDLLQLSSHLQRIEQQRRSSESEAG